MDKGNTDGMYLKTITGKKVTREDFEKNFAEYQQKKQNNEPINPNFKFSKSYYYKNANGVTIKFDEITFRGFYLDENNEWVFSEELTQRFNNGDISGLERIMYFRDTFPEKGEATPRLGI